MQKEKFQKNLLEWYAVHQRILPWRLQSPNPYYTWISEIMLQQTTVATVISYFERFIRRWPTLSNLSTASLDDVLHLWQGLGYYSRARNLHRCAREVMEKFGGIFPFEEADLKSLPGIGDYTAAAIRTIAFQKPAIVVDGNIERIMSRLFMVQDPLPFSKTLLKEYAATLAPQENPGDYAQALMDLGATVCTPLNPKCFLCPLRLHCKASLENPEDYPKRLPKKEKPKKYGLAFWLEDPQGRVLLEQRPEKGLLGGLMGVPTSPWITDGTLEKQLTYAPVPAQWQLIGPLVTHTFTHFHLTLSIARAVTYSSPLGLWTSRDDFDSKAFPTLMRKVIKAVGPLP